MIHRLLHTSLLLLFALTVNSCLFFQDIRIGDIPQQVEDEWVTEPDGVDIEIWQTGLEVPWSLLFLDDETALVSERPGRIRLIENGVMRDEPYIELDVFNAGEAGLMGLAAHPDFPNSPYIYAMLTEGSTVSSTNRVVRLRHLGDSAVFDRIIVDDIPGFRFHNGGRIGFGPDDMLYVTTGENFRPSLAQDLENKAGKILRVTPDGEIPADNPFGDSPVYSYGHRNPQGLAWHPETGLLFSSEHGPSGEYRVQGHDIINLIKKGKNYGWPEVIGKVGSRRYEDPIVMWEPATPPGGMTFWNGDLYVATMKSRALIRIRMDIEQSGENPEDAEIEITGIERWFATDEESGIYGRFRDAVTGPDGALYVTISNRDGRGSPHEDDDRILRITQKSQ